MKRVERSRNNNSALGQSKKKKADDREKPDTDLPKESTFGRERGQ